MTVRAVASSQPAGRGQGFFALNLARKIRHHIGDHPAIPALTGEILSALHLQEGHPLVCKDLVVSFAGRSLAFPSQVMAFRLFKIFSEVMTPYQISKAALIRSLYALDISTLSERQRYCLHNNVNKMITRCRRLALEHFDDSEDPLWDWLAYNPTLKHYSLIKVRRGKQEQVLQMFLSYGLSYLSSSQPLQREA